MGYKIYYSSKKNKKYPSLKKLSSIYTKSAILFFVIILIVVLAKVDDSGYIRKLILPGNPKVNKQAIESLISDLDSGVSIQDAFIEFCMEIVEDGKTQYEDLY